MQYIGEPQYHWKAASFLGPAQLSVAFFAHTQGNPGNKENLEGGGRGG